MAIYQIEIEGPSKRGQLVLVQATTRRAPPARERQHSLPPNSDPDILLSARARRSVSLGGGGVKVTCTKLREQALPGCGRVHLNVAEGCFASSGWLAKI